jgi:hypothetical protein
MVSEAENKKEGKGMYSVYQKSNAFFVKTKAQGQTCAKQGCRVAGNCVITVYPNPGTVLSLPFKVEIGTPGEDAVLTQHFRFDGMVGHDTARFTIF